jgi:hypothetical protein
VEFLAQGIAFHVDAAAFVCIDTSHADWIAIVKLCTSVSVGPDTPHVFAMVVGIYRSISLTEMRHLSDDGAVDGLEGEDMLVLNAASDEACVDETGSD